MAKQLTGTVTSDKVDKTIVITVRARKTHPLYKKQYTVNTKFMAHDEKNEAHTGDLVSIVETRPISRRKHFKLGQILERAGAAFVEADATADVPEEAIAPQVEKPVEKTAKTEKQPAKSGEKQPEPEEAK